MSGIVWTYPPNGSAAAAAAAAASSASSSANYGSGNYGHANNNNANNNNVHAFGGPALPALPNVAGPAAAAAAVNNGINNIIGNQQAVQQHPMRLSSAERDSSGNGANYPSDENKKYNVSVSFDR